MEKTAGCSRPEFAVVHQPDEERPHHPAIDRRQKISMRRRAQKGAGLEQYAVNGAQTQQHLVVRHAGVGAQRKNRLQEELEAFSVQGALDFVELMLIRLRQERREPRRSNSAARHTITGASRCSNGSVVLGRRFANRC